MPRRVFPSSGHLSSRRPQHRELLFKVLAASGRIVIPAPEVVVHACCSGGLQPGQTGRTCFGAGCDPGSGWGGGFQGLCCGQGSFPSTFVWFSCPTDVRINKLKDAVFCRLWSWGRRGTSGEGVAKATSQGGVCLRCADCRGTPLQIAPLLCLAFWWQVHLDGNLA